MIGSRRIMYQHPIIFICPLGQLLQAIHNGMTTLGTACRCCNVLITVAWLNALPICIVFRNHHHDTRQLLASKQRIKCMLQYCFLTQWQVLLGNVRGHTPSGTGSGHERPEF